MKIQPSFCLCGITRAPNAAPHSACSFFARCGAWLLALAVYACSSLPAWAHNICTNTQGVTVVLGGGGAKGFAHLAVLQKLEALRIPIRQVIGTSMGAVIGGLYASGMSTAAIEKVIRSQDPSKVALDQVDRTDLPHRTRAYQQQYPVDLELGVKSGQLSFARGVSDGQRFLALLQELTAHIPANGSFDALKIPFRAVATRLSDGEMVVLDHGSLPLAIRASMSAPGVFAPLEIGEETYIDGGLVANLPVEVALREGASTIVASYLGDTDRVDTTAEPSNALTVANRMLVLLVRQNERRNIALLRPQDILVRPAMQNYRFGDFQRAEEIMQAGQQAIATQADRFQALADQSPCETTPIHPHTPSATTTTTAVAIQIAAIEVRGNEYVPSAYIEDFLRPLLHTAYSASAVSLTLDALYTTGNFERLNYQLRTTDDMQVQLVIDVKEKPYGPTYIKTSLGFFSESSGSNMFSAGAGLRRPWLTPSGLELTVDALMGSQTHLAASLFQPLPSQGWGLNAYAAYKSLDLPIYRSDIGTAQKMALSTLRRQEAGMNLSYDFSKQFTSKLGLSANVTSTAINTARNINYTNADGSPVVYSLQDSSEPARNVYAQFTADVLDSPSFPTRGYFANLLAVHSQGSSVQWESIRFNTLLTYSAGSHVLHLGVNLGTDKALDCEDCTDNSGSLSPLFLGGFQAMGAYQVGQLRGDRLAHAQSTYMYRLSDGGLLRQPTYVGVVLEVGDAWLHTASMQHRYSGTGFIAIDSKIGDVFFGVASGSDNNKNIFIQLGKRFTVW